MKVSLFPKNLFILVPRTQDIPLNGHKLQMTFSSLVKLFLSTLTQGLLSTQYIPSFQHWWHHFFFHSKEFQDSEVFFFFAHFKHLQRLRTHPENSIMHMHPCPQPSGWMPQNSMWKEGQRPAQSSLLRVQLPLQPQIHSHWYTVSLSSRDARSLPLPSKVS